MQRLRTDGKFFRAGEDRVQIRCVTYGPFPGGWPTDFSGDFTQIGAAGFRALRLYELPDRKLLDAAAQHGLWIFAGLKWASGMDFLAQPELYTAARVQMAEFLREFGQHPALAGIYIGNEVPADLARWMGPVRVREALEDLIDLGRGLAPQLLFAYGNYPSTEYLEPGNADFTAFNIYLEDPSAFRKYLRRLHHLAGDRPVFISEFGLDSLGHGETKQATTLSWALQIAEEADAAGFTIFSWSDRWQNGLRDMSDWAFGLIRRDGTAKPALEALRQIQPRSLSVSGRFSVIICTRNGAARIPGCLRAVQRMTDPDFETIVVDDGSTDHTASLVDRHFPWVKLIRLAPGGLSHARNAGAEAASGEFLAFTDDDCEPDREWLSRLRPILDSRQFGAVGGPNLPPPSRSWEEAVVAAAPGAPTHVMLDDMEAEHLPGCNLVVRRDAFDSIGGFNLIFHTAGDDVDFCWRLRDRGWRLGFAPGAFVWHWRRSSLRAYLRQQLGYGRAERLLFGVHPNRFSANGDAIWKGTVYTGSALNVVPGSIIYHGSMGLAGYQSVVTGTMPIRRIEPRYRDHGFLTAAALRVISWLQPRLRAWARAAVRGLWSFCSNDGWRGSQMDEREGSCLLARDGSCLDFQEFSIWSQTGRTREHFLRFLISSGWRPGGETEDWDVIRDGTKLLLATELGAESGRRTWVRIIGPLPAGLLATLSAIADDPH